MTMPDLGSRTPTTAALGALAAAGDDARFRAMADCAPVLLWMSGLDSECQFFNQTWLDFTGRPLEREIGVGWAEGVHPEDLQRCMDVYLAAFIARREFRMEYRLRRHDGEYRWLLDHGRPWFLEDGSFAGFIGSCVDVTEMKLAQQSLLDTNAHLHVMLREKDALVSEVHHRVKNNLQLVSSLLTWNERRVDAPAVRAFSEDLRNRIHSIALIHERLYRARDLGRIDLGGYARELCDHLAAAHGSSRVSLRCQVVPLDVPLDMAVPFGLVLTELVTNAFKHAFCDRPRGTIVVSIDRRDGEAIVTVSDDGVGLPADAFARPGFGFDMVRTLAQQLGARLESHGGEGTRIGLSFGTGG